MLLNTNTVSVESQVSNHFTVGIDQGDSLWQVTILDRQTGKYSRHSLRGVTKETECYQMISELTKIGRPVSVCYEAGRYGFTPARKFQDMGCSVRILPVNKVEIISSGKKVKTDKIDSQFLSEINPLDDTIPSVWIPTIEQECKKNLPKEAHRLQIDIARNNNRILSILKRFDFPKYSTHKSASDWEKIIKKWKKEKIIPNKLPTLELYRIEMMVDEMKTFETNYKKWKEVMEDVEKEEREECKTNNERYAIDVLRKYKGMGLVLPRAFAWGIVDFKRFKNGKHLSSYLGLTPTPFSSGRKFVEQGISKQGNTELRRQAIQLAWLWYHWQKGSALTKKWSPQLQKKGRQRRTAIVGMARQLMVALYRDVVKGETIEGAKINLPIK